MKVENLKNYELLIIKDFQKENLIVNCSKDEDLPKDKAEEVVNNILTENFDFKVINIKTNLWLKKGLIFDNQLVFDFLFLYLEVIREIYWDEAANLIKKIFGKQFVEKNSNGDWVVHKDIKKMIRAHDNIKYSNEIWSYKKEL